MTLGRIGRIFSITDYGYQIYHIYQNQTQSTWRKVSRILTRFLGMTMDGFICIHSNRNPSAKILSMVIDGVITPIMDTENIKDLLHPVANASIIAKSAGVVKISDDASYFIQCLIHKRKGCETFLNSIKESYKGSSASSFSPDLKISQLLLQLEKTNPDSCRNFTQEIIEDYKRILNSVDAESYPRIPYCFYHKKFFQNKICVISSRPTREPVLIKGSSGEIVRYEFYYLLSWWFNSLDDLPPSWPKSVAFDRKLFIIDESEKAQITKTLQQELDKVDKKKIKIELASVESFLQRIK